jgi:hypothetical protein
MIVSLVYPVGAPAMTFGPLASQGARRRGSPDACAKPDGKGDRVPDYYLIPILLVLMSLAIVGLIYWGGFIEERRNSRNKA